ncbi:hypothetical protein MP638_002939, partial [Amoeboaphelidium occidentale]
SFFHSKKKIMVAKKHKSKRISCSQRYKIQKKVKAHHKKLNKDPVNLNKRKKKIEKNHIPNSFPYKEELLMEIQQERNQQQEQQQEQLERFVESVQERVEDYDNNCNNNNNNNNNNQSLQSNQFKKLTRKSLVRVLSESDLVLSVVDIRDPLNSMLSLSSSTSSSSTSNNNINKKILLVLNKCDLVPVDVAMEWLRYFRLNKESFNLCNVVLCSCQKKIGMKELKACIKNTLIGKGGGGSGGGGGGSGGVVGVVGMPNVGKSALINSLIGLYGSSSSSSSKGNGKGDVVVSASKAGETKHLKRIKLEKNLFLLDSPGHCELSSSSSSSGSIDRLLLGVVNYEQFESTSAAAAGGGGGGDDLVVVIEELFSRLNENVVLLEKIYGLYAFRNALEFLQMNALEFLQMLARKSGKLRRGGVLDVRAAAIMVLKDWFQGKIPYYTRVPTRLEEQKGEDASAAAAAAAVIVSEYGQEFKWDCDAADVVELSGRSAAVTGGRGGGGGSGSGGSKMDVEENTRVIVGMDDIVDYESESGQEDDEDEEMDEDSDEEEEQQQQQKKKRFIGSNSGDAPVHEGQYDFREYF